MVCLILGPKPLCFSILGTFLLMGYSSKLKVFDNRLSLHSLKACVLYVLCLCSVSHLTCFLLI
ncbi:hypothetical protein Hanom_Chr16g01509951 [Helianthus anomalus]